jgi:hypothetical protein
MPLGSVSFLNRGGNEILQGILSGQNVSLTSALSGAVQLTRDASSNQLAQETAFLGERRFDRGFREAQFVDRRDFSRNVFSQDRAFGENVRQFNVNDRARGQELALRAELGRGQLEVARGGLELNRDRTEMYLRQGEQQIQRGDLLLEQAQSKEDQLEAVREQERLLNDPVALAAANPGLSPEELSTVRARGLNEVEREYTFLGRDASARLAGGEADTLGVLPGRTPADDAAGNLVTEADTLAATGDLAGSLTTLARAQATAVKGSPMEAAIIQQRAIVASQLTAAGEDSESLISANAANDLFLEGKATVFGESTTIDKEIAKVREAVTAEDYARDESDLPLRSREKLTSAQRDARVKKRLEFFFNVERSSDVDINRAKSKSDPNSSYLNGLLGE